MATDSEIRLWAKETGRTVSERGRIGAGLRAEYAEDQPPATRRIPDPGEIAEDMGIIDVDPPSASTPTPGPGPDTPPRPGPGPVASDPDDGPAHVRRDWKTRRTASAKPGPPRPARITASVRDDIEAKIGFALTVPGHVWAARDPLCGGTFLEQIPAIAASASAWVIRSPALVEWFTSPAGSGFILLLDSAAAFGPVISAVMAHHVYHSVELGQADDTAAPSPYQQYAA
jgi:hypothetical protein